MNKKNCKQIEALRMLEDRSGDGLADIWMVAVSVACGTLFHRDRTKGVVKVYQEESPGIYATNRR